MLDILVFFLVFLTVSYWWRWHSSLSRWDHIPGMKSWSHLPIVGHAYVLAKDPLGTLCQLAKKHGNVMRFDVGGAPTGEIMYS